MTKWKIISALTAASLEDAEIFESHPGAEGGADQHTDQHHDLLPKVVGVVVSGIINI